MNVHPQVAALLQRVARSPLPPYHTVSPFVARRIYRETRAALSGVAPPVAESRLLIFDRIAVRAYRPVSGEVLPALVYFHGGGWWVRCLRRRDVLCWQLASGGGGAVLRAAYPLCPG